MISPPIDSSSASPVASAEVPPVDPPLLALPEPAACVMTTAYWRGAKTKSELRFREGGPIFARVAGGKASLHLPVGPATGGAGIEIADASLGLRGHLASSEIWLHPAKVIVLSEAVIPLYGSKLEWAQARPGTVAVTFEPHEGVTFSTPQLAADVPCDALSLDDTSIEPEAALPALKSEKQALLRAGRSIPLSTTAGGAALASLTAEAGEDSIITVLETKGKNTRISWQRSTFLIFGWVATSQLEFPRKLPAMHGFGTGSGGGFGRSIHPVARVTCPEDVPFVVEVEGERMSVGQIFAGAVINVMDRGEEYRSVVIRSGVIQIEEGKMLVRAERLKDCPIAPP